VGERQMGRATFGLDTKTGNGKDWIKCSAARRSRRRRRRRRYYEERVGGSRRRRRAGPMQGIVGGPRAEGVPAACDRDSACKSFSSRSFAVGVIIPFRVERRQPPFTRAPLTAPTRARAIARSPPYLHARGHDAVHYYYYYYYTIVVSFSTVFPTSVAAATQHRPLTIKLIIPLLFFFFFDRFSAV